MKKHFSSLRKRKLKANKNFFFLEGESPTLHFHESHQEIDETVNFQKLLTNTFAAFFMASWHPIFKREKQTQVAGHMKDAAMAITCTLGKLM